MSASFVVGLAIRSAPEWVICAARPAWPHPVHGRILQADLTHEGHAALRSCHQAVDAIEEQMLATLSPARRQQLTAALRTCIEALPQSRQPAP